MLKRIVQISFLAFLSWVFSPVLNTILPLPTESMVEGFLNSSDENYDWWLKFFRYVVWIIFLALLFKYTKPILSFVLPVSRRYGTTKPVRRFHAIAADIVFVLFFLAFSALTIGISISANEFYENYDLLKKKNKHLIEITPQLRENVELAKKNREEAKRFVELHEEGKYFYKPVAIGGMWPTNEKQKISYPLYKDSLEKPYKYSSIRFFDAYEEKDDNSRKYQGYPRPTLFTREKSLSIAKHPYYQYYYYKQKELFKEYPQIEFFLEENIWIEGFENYPIKEKIQIIEEISYQQTIHELGEPFDLFKGKVKDYWVYILAGAALLYFIMVFIGRYKIGLAYEKVILFFQQGRFGLGGSARFSGMLEEWALDFSHQTQRLYMGRSLYKKSLMIGLEDPRHMLTIAGTRAGKGATAIIPNLILWGGSTLVIDPKGANATVTAMRRKNALNQDVHIIDPFHIIDIPDDERACLNPLEFLDINSPSIREQINIIAEAIVVPDQNQKEKHWDDGAKTVIAGLIAHLISSDKYENPALHHLRDLISCMPEEQDLLWAEMSMNDKAGRLAKDAANRVIRGINTNEISSILSNADKHTEWLSSPAMAKILGSSTFQFSEMKDKPTTIYLVLPPEYLETHNRFLRLFINLAINQMSVGGRSKVPVMLMLDEFLALGRMEEVEKAFGLMAGYNLTIWPFVQDLGRLRDLYGKSVNAFIANSRAVQVFGVNDEETKEFVSKAIGNRKLDASIVGNGNNKNTSVKLRDETEVGLDIAADTGRQYILRAGKTPLVIEKTPYYSDQLFAGKYTPDPDYKK